MPSATQPDYLMTVGWQTLGTSLAVLGILLVVVALACLAEHHWYKGK